jgi:hypothetical protein
MLVSSVYLLRFLFESKSFRCVSFTPFLVRCSETCLKALSWRSAAFGSANLRMNSQIAEESKGGPNRP